MNDGVRIWQLIEAVVFRRTNIVERIGVYELSGDRFSAIRRINGKVISTTAAMIDGNEGPGVDRKSIEGIISRLNFPFKFTVQVSTLNTAKLLGSLQTRRAMREIELSKISQSTRGRERIRANAARRELELIEQDIKSMTTGSAPLRMSLLISTSAVSESKFYAEERSKSQIRELAGEFGAITSSRVRVLRGAELSDALVADSTMML